MAIFFPMIPDPFAQRMVEVRIPDEQAPGGFSKLFAVQISRNVAATVQLGSLELLQIEETDLEDVVNFIDSTLPLATKMNEGMYWQTLLRHANTLTVSEFLQVHRHLFFEQSC